MKRAAAQLLLLLVISASAFAQDDETIIDKVQGVIEIRKSFDTKSETTKPALLSYTGESGEKAIYKIDLAVLYRGFFSERAGIGPAVQVEYTSSGKSRQEFFKGSLIGYWDVYGSPGSYFKIEPSASFSREFITKINKVEGRLVLFPRFPGFIIPVRNVSDIKPAKSGAWVTGFNPSVGFVYEDKIGKKIQQDLQRAYSVASGNLSFKKTMLLFDLFGKYEKEFDSDAGDAYRYGASMTVYFDVKERSSFNIRVENENKDTRRTDNETSKVTFGIGIKL
jgi:hypothetical protein